MICKKANIIFFIAALLCSTALLFACRAKRVKTKKPAAVEQSAFFTLSLSRDTVAKQTSARIKNVTVVDAKTRYMPDEAKAKEPNFLRIEVIYKNDQVLQAITEHPLYKRFDLYSESGQIESKLISLPQGEVIFRLPYFEEYKRIRIVETIGYKESPPIILKHEK